MDLAWELFLYNYFLNTYFKADQVWSGDSIIDVNATFI